MAAERSESPAPGGCIALAFTDVEGSSSLWDADAPAMREGIRLHNELLRRLLAKHQGYEVKTEGDAFMVAFVSPADALAWCLECQCGLLAAPWPAELLARAEAAAVASALDRSRPLYRGLRVRMGVHLGTPDCVPDPTTGRMDYFGPVVNRAARVAGAAHGGQVLLSDAVRAALGGEFPGARLRPLGTFHLKGLTSPEPLHEALPVSLAERAFPPVRARAPRRVSLPQPAGRCLGRDDELAELAHRFDEGARLITLLGPGGIGKTRLAIELGRYLAARPEREAAEVLFCDLTSAGSASEVAGLVARTAGCSFGPVAATEELVESVGSDLAEHEGLLAILDNFEQVASHAVETVGRWRQLSPGTAFLVTSREPLGLESELAFRLTPLAPAPAVELFLERLATTRRGVVLSEAERSVVEQIARRLDGIPLALELAAGRVGVLTVSQLERQLAHRFKVLTSSRRDLAARQATLRGAIDWSWRLLGPPERELLASLSVFHGFTLEAVEATMAPGQDASALDLLQALVDRSMVQASLEGESTRFHLLASIRDFAAEKLRESGQAAEAQLRHARYFAELAASRLTGAFLDDDRIDREQLEQEQDNLAAALEVEALPTVERLRVLLALCGEVYVRRPLADLAALAVRGEALASGAEVPPDLRCRAMDLLGTCRWLEGDLVRARDALERARTLAEQSADPTLRAWVLKDLASVYLLEGDETEAEILLTRATAEARASGDPIVESRMTGNLGHVAYRQCRFEDCLVLFARQMELTAARPDSLDRGFAETNLAGALLGLGRYAEARQSYERALVIFERLGHFRFSSMSQCGLAYTRVMLGEGALALEGVVQTLATARRHGLKWATAHALSSIGIVRLESGQGPEGLRVLEECVQVSRASSDRNMLGLSIAYRGAAHALCDEPERALADLAESATLLGSATTVCRDGLEGLVFVARSRLAARAGDEREARRWMEAARERLALVKGWQDGSLPPAVPGPGGRFVGVALPLLERAVERLAAAVGGSR